MWRKERWEVTVEDTVSLTGVSLSFGAGRVFSGLSASFPKGSRTCVTGPSGCGKTSLLRMVLGLLSPDEGSVSVPKGWSASAVFQEDRLLAGFSGIYNVRLVCPRGISDRDIENALCQVGIPGESCYLPVRQLSGGMARRTAIVRAVLAEGELLVMDEPFKGLDPENREKTVNFVMENLRGRTLIAATHEPQDVELLRAELLRL